MHSSSAGSSRARIPWLRSRQSRSGTPVVATTASSVPEVAGDAAILVDPGDPVALAGGIERALADRERLAPAGLQRARRVNWAETARPTPQGYPEVVLAS